MKTITIIGNGSMALALAKGLEDSYKLEIAGRNKEKLQTFSSSLQSKPPFYLIDGFNVEGKTLLLCTKPNNLEEVFGKLTGKPKTLYSVLAGVSIEKLKNHSKASQVVRAMPNLAAKYALSMTTLTGEETLKEEAETIFNAIGKTLWVQTQKELDIATALAGSGPAYLALIAEALSDGAVKQGLKRTDATLLTQGLFEGFAKLLQENHPAVLKDNVMSPGGTTACGYAALEKNGVRNGCIKAVEEAYKRTLQL